MAAGTDSTRTCKCILTEYRNKCHGQYLHCSYN